MVKRTLQRPYYGWFVVAAAFVSLFISVGFLFYSYGVFFPALEEDFGGSRFAIAIGLAMMNLSMGAFAPYLGRVLDTWSIRGVMMIGATTMAAGFLLASRISALWQFYVLLASFLGIGASMIGQLPSLTLVSNWFEKRRGLALGIATMGVSMSGMIMAPVTTMLITHFGWRHTFIVFGVLAVGIVVPLVRLLVIDRPSRIGLAPDGAPLAEEPTPVARPGGSLHQPIESDFSAIATLRDRNFWAITLTTALNFFGMSAILVHMIPHARDLGINALDASYVMSACAGAGVVGKVVFGYIADRIDTRMALFVSIVFQITGASLLLFAESHTLLLVVGAVFGFGMGGVVPLWGSLVGDYFGRAIFGRVMGLITPCMLPIQISGVPFAGFVFDRTGSYDIAFKTFLCTYVVAASMLLLLRRRAPAALPR